MQRLSQFFKNPVSASLLLTGTSMLPLAIRFFLLPVYLLVLDVDDYGMLAIINIIGSFFEIFGNLKLETAVQTYYYDYAKQPEKLKAYISNIFTASVLISFGLLVLLVVSGPTILDWILKNDDLYFFPDVLIILCTSFLLINLRIYYAYIKNKKSFLEFVGYSLTSLFLNIGFQLFFLFQMDMGITGILLGNLVGTSLVFIYFIITNLNLISFNLKWEFIRPSLGYSVTLIPFLIFFWANQKIDRFFIEHFLGWEWVGKFAVLIALTNLIRIIITSANTSFRPFLFEYFSEGVEKNKDKILLLQRIFIYIIYLAVSVVILVGTNLDLIILKPKFLEIMPLIPLASMVPLALGYARLFNQQLVFSKNANSITVVSIIAFAIMMPCYYFLIPVFKLEGIILTNIFGNIFAAVCFCFYGNKYFPIKHNVMLLCILPVLFYSIVFFLVYLSNIAIIEFRYIGIIQFVLVILGLLFVGKVDIKNFVKVRRSRRKSIASKKESL